VLEPPVQTSVRVSIAYVFLLKGSSQHRNLSLSLLALRLHPGLIAGYGVFTLKISGVLTYRRILVVRIPTEKTCQKRKRVSPH